MRKNNTPVHSGRPYHPAQGRVLIEGSVPNHKEHQIGYMLQQDYLFPWKSIEENVPLRFTHFKNINRRKRAEVLSLLPKLGLIGVEKKYPKELSGGMRRWAALARTLAPDPGLSLP